MTSQNPESSPLNLRAAALVKIDGACTTVSPNAGEKMFAVMVLLLESGAFSTLAVTEGQITNQAGGSFAWQIFWILIYLATISLICRHCPGFLRQILRAWPLVAFTVLAVVSTAWSDDPALSFRRGVLLSFSVVFGFYLARRFSIREQLHLLAWVCGICIFFSYPFGLLHLGGTVDYYPNAWHGIFVQKNDFGRMMVLSLLVFLVCAKTETVRRWRMRMGVLAALILLLLSHSATAAVVAALMFALFRLSRILRKSFGKAVAGMVLVTLGGMGALFWVFTHPAIFADALGRSVTMSGRLQLWALCVVMALRKPWLGYGYNAFWLGIQGPSLHIWRALDIQIPHAHNGFIQVWLDLGLAGVALLVLIFTTYTIRAASVVRQSDQPEDLWPLMVLTFSFLYILTEITIPSDHPIFMMLFSSAIFATSFRIPHSVTVGALTPRIGQRHTAVNHGLALGAGVEGA